MSGDPDRLSPSSEDKEHRALLEEGKRELPTEGQHASLAAKLGPLGGGGGSGGSHAGGVSAKEMGTVKGAAILVAATTALWGGVHLFTKKPPHAPPRPRFASQSPAEVRSRFLDTQDASLLGDASDDDDVELPPPLPTMTTATATAPPRPKPSASALPAAKPVLPPPSESASELILLKAAQDALIEDPRKALTIIDDDLRRYPNGVLRQEAEVIGIDALSRMGNGAAARARADKFRSMYPGSTHVRRIDAILGRSE